MIKISAYFNELSCPVNVELRRSKHIDEAVKWLDDNMPEILFAKQLRITKTNHRGQVEFSMHTNPRDLMSRRHG